MFNISYVDRGPVRQLSSATIPDKNLLQLLGGLVKNGHRITEITLDNSEGQIIDDAIRKLIPKWGHMGYYFGEPASIIVLRGYMVAFLCHLAELRYSGQLRDSALIVDRENRLRVLDRSQITAISKQKGVCGWCLRAGEFEYSHNHTYICSACANLAQHLQESKSLMSGAASSGRARDFQDRGNLQADLDQRLKLVPVSKARALGSFCDTTCHWCQLSSAGTFYDIGNTFMCSFCFRRANELQTTVDQTKAVESWVTAIMGDFGSGKIFNTMEHE